MDEYKLLSDMIRSVLLYSGSLVDRLKIQFKQEILGITKPLTDKSDSRACEMNVEWFHSIYCHKHCCYKSQKVMCHVSNRQRCHKTSGEQMELTN